MGSPARSLLIYEGNAFLAEYLAQHSIPFRRGTADRMRCDPSDEPADAFLTAASDPWRPEVACKIVEGFALFMRTAARHAASLSHTVEQANAVCSGARCHGFLLVVAAEGERVRIAAEAPRSTERPCSLAFMKTLLSTPVQYAGISTWALSTREMVGKIVSRADDLFGSILQCTPCPSEDLLLNVLARDLGRDAALEVAAKIGSLSRLVASCVSEHASARLEGEGTGELWRRIVQKYDLQHVDRRAFERLIRRLGVGAGAAPPPHSMWPVVLASPGAGLRAFRRFHGTRAAVQFADTSAPERMLAFFSEHPDGAVLADAARCGAGILEGIGTDFALAELVMHTRDLLPIAGMPWEGAMEEVTDVLGEVFLAAEMHAVALVLTWSEILRHAAASGLSASWIRQSIAALAAEAGIRFRQRGLFAAYHQIADQILYGMADEMLASVVHDALAAILGSAHFREAFRKEAVRKMEK